MPQFTRPSKSLTASVCLNIALIATCGYGAFLYFNDHQQITDMRSKLEAANTKNQSMTNTIGDLTSKIAELEKKPTGPTKDEIEAFAKQAAACDALKHKLNIHD